MKILAPEKLYALAGHNNNDPGAVSNGRKEAVETQKVRNEIRKNYEATEFISDNDSATNRQVQNTIKPGSGSVLLDIHFNAASPTATGVECFVSKADFANKNSLAYKMADEICKATARILGIHNRGVKAENQSQHNTIWSLNTKAGIKVLWEVCFITNVLDMQAFDMCYRELCKEVAEILKKYDDLR